MKKETYFKIYGEEAKVTEVHRGIECSIFGHKL